MTSLPFRRRGYDFALNPLAPGMLALKLTLVPLFLLIVSMSGKWWGPSIAGWLAGLPVVAGPILYLLVLAHGPDFGARAATLSLSAILASEAFNFAYAWTCRSRSWPIALLAGLATWLIAAFALSMLPTSPLWAAIAALSAVCFGQSFLPRSSAVAAGAPLSRADLVGRMVAGAALTIVVTSLSGWAGATWSGLLAVFPLLGSVLSVSSHRAHGPAFVISLLRGMVLGRFSFAAFCLVLVFVLPHQHPLPAFAEAAFVAMFVQWCTKRLATMKNPENEKPAVVAAE
ncbi:hypothetical protein SAMN05443245_6659 [Paraburkholderia fungorum]|uniref:Uncharacterized protein n=2 Tax=Paraburkholderia fungorum TaxID=134537 RepID=A0A1H1JK49_9BURK|nr:hypothetical protein SAMN05443245_6659 [Paraburkholderia fungorum]